MATRTITVNGTEWTIEPTGRWTQYIKDEFSICFTNAVSGERRMARYSPLGAKRRDASLAELSDTQLMDLFRRSQPAWTADELGYR
jgi:hypothetical protein